MQDAGNKSAERGGLPGKACGGLAARDRTEQGWEETGLRRWPGRGGHVELSHMHTFTPALAPSPPSGPPSPFLRHRWAFGPIPPPLGRPAGRRNDRHVHSPRGQRALRRLLAAAAAVARQHLQASVAGAALLPRTLHGAERGLSVRPGQACGPARAGKGPVCVRGREREESARWAGSSPVTPHPCPQLRADRRAQALLREACHLLRPVRQSHPRLFRARCVRAPQFPLPIPIPRSHLYGLESTPCPNS